MKYLTITEVAAQLSISPRQANRVARSILHVRIGRTIRVPERALAEWVRQHTEEPPKWDASTVVVTPGTPTGRTPRAGRNADRSARRTRQSQGQGSASSSWLRPIQPRTRGTR